MYFRRARKTNGSEHIAFATNLWGRAQRHYINAVLGRRVVGYVYVVYFVTDVRSSGDRIDISTNRRVVLGPENVENPKRVHIFGAVRDG